MTRIFLIFAIFFATPTYANSYTCAWEYGDKLHIQVYEVRGDSVKENDSSVTYDVIQDNQSYFSFMKHYYADDKLGYMTSVHIINKKNGHYINHQIHSPYATYKLIGTCEKQ